MRKYRKRNPLEPQDGMVDYVCIVCSSVNSTRRHRINPEGNRCKPCGVRWAMARRKASGGYVFSDEHRAKLSIAHAGKPAPWNSGPKTPEHIQKLRLSHIGRPSHNKGKWTTPPDVRRKNEKVHDTCSGMVRRILKLKNEDKVRRTFDQLGYTKADFVSRIESQFSDGMNWDNYGEWHVDHIKPVSAFVKEGILDVATINALPNLQPLWKLDNLRKGGRYTTNAVS